MYLCNFLHTYCVPTRKTNSPANAPWFAADFLAAVVTMMKQNMSYIYLVIHFIVCNIVALFVVVNIRKDIYLNFGER